MGNDEEILEGLVDKVGAARVLYMLATVGHAKAEHLRSNWQDENAARDWERFSRHMDRTAATVVVQAVTP